MEPEELIKQAARIRDKAKHIGKQYIEGALTEALEFFRVYAGERSAFSLQLNKMQLGASPDWIRETIIGNLDAFIGYVESGLLGGISVERKAQIDVVSDFLEQAHVLLDSNDVHPAAPTVIVGAALEEFLRNWIEEDDLDLGGEKPSLDSYKNVLRKADLITKQDSKDITAWAGLRNHAAHGEWDEVSDRNRITIMLEGVNLFMRKYGEKPSVS